MREWKRRLGWCMPVSVNVSRVDMYDSDIVDTLQHVLSTYDLGASEPHLEVTESAHAEDSKQIIEMVGRLRSVGFRIEMDDFGTGYSSLDMPATLPIDVLKLDMRFVRTAFSQEGDGDAHMLGAVADIARHLSVPLVAEGVETQEQLDAPRDLGCDTVQGYFFSEPVPAGRFEPFVEAGKRAYDAANAAQAEARTRAQAAPTQDEPRKSWWERLPAVSLRRAEPVWASLAALVAIALVFAMSVVSQGLKNTQDANERYILARQAASDLEMGSDYLTENVRSFVMTGDISYMDNYFEELASPGGATRPWPSSRRSLRAMPTSRRSTT